MNKTLGQKIEAWAIMALRAEGTLPADLQVVEYNSSEASEPERVVARVTVGEQLLEGQKPFAAELEITFNTVNRNSDEANDVFARIETALTGALNVSVVQDYVNENFTWLLVITEQAKNTISESPNYRTYTRTIPLQAATR